MALHAPDYDGTGLVNLVAEIERRLIGKAPMPGLTDPAVLPEASGYVLMVFDGLGSHQVGGELAESRHAVLTAGFPTTTTTSLSSLVTGLPPSGHGIIGHMMRLPGVADVVNVLKWVTPAGRKVSHDYASMLPSPNLWERLAAGGVEPITVQPGDFTGSPLSKMLYRGCRFEPAWNVADLVAATADLAGPGRLVMTYFPNVDVAAHVTGQRSRPYRVALAEATTIWEQLCLRLPAETGLVGTSDHGLVDYTPEAKVLIRDRRYDDLVFYGDPRSVHISGPTDLIGDLAVETGATVVEPSQLTTWLGPGDHHPELGGRLPDRLLLAPPGRVLLPKQFDKRLVGYHGGLEPEEIEVPLLVR